MSGLAILAAHLAGDFLLQTDRMAAEKFDSTTVRTLHATIHAGLLFVTVAVAIAPRFETAVLFVALASAAHWLIDTRRWVEPKDGFEAKPIWVDQSLHVVSLAAIYTVVISSV